MTFILNNAAIYVEAQLAGIELYFENSNNFKNNVSSRYSHVKDL